MRPVTNFPLRHQIAARTRFFDDQVLAALAAGTTQVVLCGAGFDDRALRFRASGVRYFELDHPGTQSAKAAQLRSINADPSGLTLAAADFRTDDVSAVLEGCGHDAEQATLFICEGLLVYLDQGACVRLLAGLRSRVVGAAATSTSVLAASLAVHRQGVDSDEVVGVANARRRTGGTEPWRTILPVDAHLALVRQAGWEPRRQVDVAELDVQAPPGRSLLIAAAPATPG
jgi:methyltransferase (TIGR00027 family)